MAYALTVIIPTFNEEGNVGQMIRAVDSVCRTHGIPAEILIVDDNSRDATQEIARRLQEGMGNVRMLVRRGDPGLSQSLYDGMLHASAPVIQCIDCDFSHPPEKIPQIYRCVTEGGFDMVIGSRYIAGGKVINWSLKRRILSSGAALIGRLLIPHIRDSGSGFFAIRRNILEGARLTPRGFRMGFEILGKARWTKVREVPIVFRDRIQGTSKMRWGIIADYLIQCGGILKYNFIERKSNNIIRAWRCFLSGKTRDPRGNTVCGEGG